MNRRIFLKLLGISPIVPSVLMAKEINHYAPVPVSGLKRSEEAKMQKVSQDIYGSPDMLEMRQPMRVFMSNSELEHFIKCHRFPDDMKFGDMIYGSILTEY